MADAADLRQRIEGVRGRRAERRGHETRHQPGLTVRCDLPRQRPHPFLDLFGGKKNVRCHQLPSLAKRTSRCRAVAGGLDRRVRKTLDWPAFKAAVYPKLKPALQKKFPANTWI